MSQSWLRGVINVINSTSKPGSSRTGNDWKMQGRGSDPTHMAKCANPLANAKPAASQNGLVPNPLPARGLCAILVEVARKRRES
jgi:hypothetical protein